MIMNQTKFKNIYNSVTANEKQLHCISIYIL